MKRKKHVLWTLLMAFALTVMLGGCGGGGGGSGGGGDGPISDIDIETLNGDWVPDSGGFGAASGDGYDFFIHLSDPPGSINFRVRNPAEEDASIQIDSTIKWDFFWRNEIHVDVPLGLEDKGIIRIRYIGKDSFEFRSRDGRTAFRAQFTSNTTLDVDERGSYEIPNPENSAETITVDYSVRYTLIKQVEEENGEE